jgi:hypothetical protein
MVLADEEDHLEFLKKCGFSNYHGLDGSVIIFRVAPRGKFKNLEVKKEEIEALQKIGRIVHIRAATGQEGQEGEKEKDKPYISVEVARQKELDLRQPVREQEQEKKGEEHPEHISD